MSYPRKSERNKRLIKLRIEDPKKWTFDRLAKEFNIKRPTAYQVFERHKTEVLALGDKSIPIPS